MVYFIYVVPVHMQSWMAHQRVHMCMTVGDHSTNKSFTMVGVHGLEPYRLCHCVLSLLCLFHGLDVCLFSCAVQCDKET